MPHTLSDFEITRLREAHEALGEIVKSIESGEPRQDGGVAATAAVPEPQWVAEYRRSWKFLKAVEEAGGELLPEQLSLLARKHDYDPRGLGGFYTGNGSLKREDPYRVLTDAGRRYIRQWEPEFGAS